MPAALAATPSKCKCMITHEALHHLSLVVSGIDSPYFQRLAHDRNEDWAWKRTATVLVPWPAAARAASIEDVCDAYGVEPFVADLARRVAIDGCWACANRRAQGCAPCPYWRAVAARVS